MSVSKVLQITELAENQVQAYIVFNSALAALEQSTNSELEIPVVTTPYYNDVPEARQYFVNKITQLASDTVVFLPRQYTDPETNFPINIEKFGIIQNASDTFKLTIQLSDDGLTQLPNTNQIILRPKESVIYRLGNSELYELFKVTPVSVWEKVTYSEIEPQIFKHPNEMPFYRVLTGSTQNAQYLLQKEKIIEGVTFPEETIFIAENDSDFTITVDVASDLATNTVDLASTQIVLPPRSSRLIYQSGTTLEVLLELKQTTKDYAKATYTEVSAGVYKHALEDDHYKFHRILTGATQIGNYHLRTQQTLFVVESDAANTFDITMDVASDLATDTVDPNSDTLLIKPGDSYLVYQDGVKLNIIKQLKFNTKPAKFVSFSKEFSPAVTSKSITQILTEDITFENNFTGSYQDLKTNPTNTVTMDILQNGASIGTISIDPTGVFTYTLITSPTNASIGDVIKLSETTTELANNELIVKLKGV